MKALKMEGKRLITSLRLQNFLSYGSKAEEVILQPLNVIIGRNASGKSNLIEAIKLLRGATIGLSEHFREGGGVSEYLWKGKQARAQVVPTSRIEATVVSRKKSTPFRYELGFTMSDYGPLVVDEVIGTESGPAPLFPSKSSSSRKKDQPSYSLHEGEAVLYLKNPAGPVDDRSETRSRQVLSKARGEIRLDESVLSQRRGDVYPEITYLANVFRGIRAYDEFSFRPGTFAAFPQRANLPDDFLLEDASNLGMVLDALGHEETPMVRIVEEMREFYPQVKRILSMIRDGTVRAFIEESGLTQRISANRLSRGTLRYLCLLTILCHPKPPALVCIEEPELGLHPDVMPRLAELLKTASAHTQLVVTTHSDTLVSALSDQPDAVIVCERDDDGTHLQRLESRKLKLWLEKYSLGELWRMGEIGGN
ncbi:MAG: AAA family ATPase [Acidobacteriota bacterium]